MKPPRRSDKKNGVGVSRRKKKCGRVCVNGKICKRIAGECPWHSKGKVRKRESEDRDEEDNIICAFAIRERIRRSSFCATRATKDITRFATV